MLNTKHYVAEVHGLISLFSNFVCFQNG